MEFDIDGECKQMHEMLCLITFFLHRIRSEEIQGVIYGLITWIYSPRERHSGRAGIEARSEKRETQKDLERDIARASASSLPQRST